MTDTQTRPSVLIIDDDQHVILGLTNVLDDAYEVVGANSGEEGIKLHTTRRHDVIILDMQMVGLDGYQTGAKIREIDPLVPIIVNTGHTKLYSRTDVEGALEPFAYMVKGDHDPSNLILETTVQSAVKYRQALTRIEAAAIIEKQNEEIAKRNVQLESAREAERHLRDQLVQQAKFETLANVSRGVLHDVRNLVSALSSRTRMLVDPYRHAGTFAIELQNLENCGDAQVLASRLKTIQAHPFLESLSNTSPQTDAAMLLLHKIVGILSTLETDYRIEFKQVSIERVIDCALESIGHRVELLEIVRQYEATGKYVFYGDETQLGRLFANLILNACDAMADQEKRQLCLSTSLQSERIMIRVTDNGPGIASEMRDRVFDAYVSTKQIDQSRERGLGLYIAANVVKGHGGEIIVLNAPGGGAEFVICLPLRDSAT